MKLVCKRTPTPGSGSWGVFLFVFLMILREGIETVLMLYGVVRLDTSAILEACGAVLGIGLAVLFGISFVRGTIRVNLRQFFRITTVILMVVVFQLAVTGLHELSESPHPARQQPRDGAHRPRGQQRHLLLRHHPRARRRHAAAGMAQTAAPPAPKDCEGAALRKAQWSARRERLWMTASCAASCVFILLITAEFIYARQSTALSAPHPVTLDNGAVRIPVASVSDGNLHRFELQDDGVGVRFIVIAEARPHARHCLRRLRHLRRAGLSIRKVPK